MNNAKDNSEKDREKRDKKEQNSQGGTEKIQKENPQQLQNDAHKMNKRVNDVQGAVDYDQTARDAKDDDHNEIENRWKNISADYRRRYPNITEDDITYKSGEFDNMIDRIATRTNRDRDAISKEIKNWQS